MGLFEDALRTLDDISHEVGKHASHAAADVGKAVNGIGQEVNKHIDPATWSTLANFGEEAGKHVGATADDIWKALLGAGEEMGEKAGPLADDARHALAGLGQEAGKHIGGAVEDAKKIEWEKLPAEIKEWIEKHPGETAGLAAGVLAAPLAMAAVPPALAAVGFTAEGVALGSAAAGIQSGIGNVAVNSLFATLMSAGQGGAGLAAVQGVVGGVAGVAGVAGVGGAAVPVLMAAASDRKKEANESDNINEQKSAMDFKEGGDPDQEYADIQPGDLTANL